jgi:hypothetical protein
MKFVNEFWLILFREYISPKLFAVWADLRGEYAGIWSEGGRRNTCSKVVGFCRAAGKDFQQSFPLPAGQSGLSWISLMTSNLRSKATNMNRGR